MSQFLAQQFAPQLHDGRQILIAGRVLWRLLQGENDAAYAVWQYHIAYRPISLDSTG